MYGWPATGMLAWSTLEPTGGLVCVCLYPPPGNTRSGDVALKAVVDTAVTSLQAKYAARADTVQHNLQRAQERERAVAEVRDAYFAVVDTSASDEQRMPMRDLWAQVEERVTAHDLHPTVEDAESVLGVHHQMKTYLTTRHGHASGDEIDAYDVHTSINMTLANQHSAASCNRSLRSMVEMAARMLVTRSTQPVRFPVNANDTPSDLGNDVAVAALARRHLRPKTGIRERPLLEFVTKRAAAATASACADAFPEFLHAHCVDPVSRTKLCSLETFEPVEDDDRFHHDSSRSRWRWSLTTTSIVIPSIAVSSARRAAVSASMVDAVTTFMTHRDPLECRTAREEEFVHGAIRASVSSGSRAATMLLAEHGISPSDFRDDRERLVVEDLLHSPPTESHSNDDDLSGLQAAAAATHTPHPPSTFGLFVLTPVPDTTTVDAVLELGSGGAWTAGESPCETIDVLGALQAFLHHKYNA